MRLSGDVMGFEFVNVNGSKYLKNRELEKMNVKHFFSTRIGGFSKGNYSELNLGVYTEDDADDVYRNMEKAFTDNKMNLNNAVYLKQVHSDKIYIVDRSNFMDIKGKFGDALITKERDLPIGVFTADCVPALVYDSKNNIIASVHAGWKGTYKCILKKTIEIMVEELNADVNSTYVVLGPAIAKCCFEVSEDVADKFNFKEKREGVYFVDLFLENKKQALSLGVDEKNIYISNICTKCNNNLFYSYRVNNSTGRIGTFISL